MAYNPFDDVIENDPAYMSNGGNLTDEDPSTKPLDITLRVQRPTPTPPVPDFISQGRQIRDKQEKLQKLQDLYTQCAFTQSMQPVYEQRQQEDFSDVQQTIASGVAPIFEGIAASETADRGKAKKEKNEQIKQQLGFGNQLSKSQMEQAKQYGYEPLTIGETFAAIPDFLYGDQAESFRKLADGEQLEDGDKYNIIMSPLDALDFLGVGVASGAVFKLLKRLKDKYKVPNLQKILDNPAFAGDGDVEEARQIVMSAAPPQGLPIEQGGRGQTVMFNKPDVPGDSTPSKLFEIDESIFGNEYNSYMKLESKEKIQKYLQTIDKFKDNPNVSKDEFFKELGISSNIMAPVITKYNKKAKNQLPSLSQNYKVTNKEADARMNKLRSDIESGVLNIEELKYKNTKDLAKEYGIDSKRITEEFPELKLDKQEQIKIANEKSVQARSQVVKDQVESMVEYKRKNQDIKDLTTFPKLQAAMREDNLSPVKNWKSMADNTDDTTQQFLSPALSKQKNPAIMNQVSQIFSNYGLKDKGFVENDILKSYLVHSNRQNLDGLTKQLESYGLQTKDQFLKANPQLTELRNKTPNKFNELYAQEMSDKYDDVVLDIIQQDIAINEPMNLIKFTNMRETQKILNKKIESLLNSLFVNDINNPALMKYREQFLSKFNEATGKKYKLDNKLVKKLMNVYGLQLSHTAPVRSKTKAIKGAGGFVDNIKLNLGGHNIAFQSTVENAIYKNFREMKKLLKNNNLKELDKKVEDLEIVDTEFKKRGMSGYYKIDDPELISYLEKKGLDVGQAERVDIPGVGEQKIQGDILLGTGESPSPEFLLNYLTNHFDEMIKDPKKIKFFLGTQGQKKLDESYIGVTTPIKKGVPYMNLKKPEMSTFNKGGPVRMAIGGDPLQNINQQQFSPDPAVDQDYFQEAVDSGNLQAANLFNLFKVFNKPKVMATPSNVKKVEEARDPIPAPTGSQEIAPLPAGKQDFFFKSFFLDQLNSQNAPKASTPQGWREFLIKGRKVPEAEMMDTGILQYLEDTEKFFPNKKITKQDLESLYDTSPLGNLEVRVKEIKAP